MAFEYYQVEDNVKARIDAQITASSLDTKLEVVVTPESEEEYKVATDKTKVTVMFAGSTGGPLKSVGDRSTTENITILCEIQSRSLRGNADYLGCHQTASILKKVLVGWQPNNCGALEFKGYKGAEPMRDAEKGLWYWQVEFSTSKLYVQEYDASDPNAPLLQNIILNDVYQS